LLGVAFGGAGAVFSCGHQRFTLAAASPTGHEDCCVGMRHGARS
jgi:hypothetical protein